MMSDVKKINNLKYFFFILIDIFNMKNSLNAKKKRKAVEHN